MHNPETSKVQWCCVLQRFEVGKRRMWHLLRNSSQRQQQRRAFNVQVLMPLLSGSGRESPSVLIALISFSTAANSGDSNQMSFQSRSPTLGLTPAPIASNMYPAGLRFGRQTAPCRAKYSRMSRESFPISPK